jgi:hypothetical protein
MIDLCDGRDAIYDRSRNTYHLFSISHVDPQAFKVVYDEVRLSPASQIIILFVYHGSRALNLSYM